MVTVIFTHKARSSGRSQQQKISDIFHEDIPAGWTLTTHFTLCIIKINNSSLHYHEQQTCLREDTSGYGPNLREDTSFQIIFYLTSEEL